MSLTLTHSREERLTRQALEAMSPNPTLTPTETRSSPMLAKGARGTEEEGEEADPAPPADCLEAADAAPTLPAKGEPPAPRGTRQADSASCSSYHVDAGWSWMIVLGAWLISFLLSGFTLSFTIVYQELKKHYGGSASETAWVLATYGAVRMFSSE